MRKINLITLAFLQATGLAVYCGMVSMFIWNANKIFGKISDFRGPLLFLILFVTSALISAIITLGYPFIFWQNKETAKAIRLILYTALFLIVYAILAIILLTIKF